MEIEFRTRIHENQTVPQVTQFLLPFTQFGNGLVFSEPQLGQAGMSRPRSSRSLQSISGVGSLSKSIVGSLQFDAGHPMDELPMGGPSTWRSQSFSQNKPVKRGSILPPQFKHFINCQTLLFV